MRNGVLDVNKEELEGMKNWLMRLPFDPPSSGLLENSHVVVVLSRSVDARKVKIRLSRQSKVQLTTVAHF